MFFLATLIENIATRRLLWMENANSDSLASSRAADMRHSDSRESKRHAALGTGGIDNHILPWLQLPAFSAVSITSSDRYYYTLLLPNHLFPTIQISPDQVGPL